MMWPWIGERRRWRWRWTVASAGVYEHILSKLTADPIRFLRLNEPVTVF